MSNLGSLNYFYFSSYHISAQDKNILSVTPHWFLIRLLGSIINLTSFGNQMNLSFSSDNMITNWWFKMYLNQNQQLFLRNTGNFELYPIENFHKTSLLTSFKNQDCYVYASDDWIPPPGSHISVRITNTLFLVKNLTITNDVKNDRRILTIKPASRKKLNNRYNSGFLQTHHQKSVYDDNFYGPIRSLHNIGLDGSGQVINIVDTGIDVMNAMFYDSENSIETISGKTNKKHRKIVRIEKYADDLDYKNGHGTHVSGIAAGNAYCTDDLCGISQYNGVASGAKIYFSDIGYSDISGDMSEDFNLKEQAKLLYEQDSYISSNSWGYDEANNEDVFNYDKIAYDNPNILYLFAAGNDYVHLSINSPGCAKNIVSVGATKAVSSSKAESSTYSVVIENESVSIECIEKSNKLIRSNGISEKMSYIVNRSVFSYDTSKKFNAAEFGFNNSIVLLNFENNAQMCNLYANVVSGGACAVIYRSSVNLKCVSLPIPTIAVSDDDFEKISEMKIASIFPFSGSDDADLPMVAPFSSKGPYDTGLSKPDFAVPGSDVMSARSHGTSSDFSVNSDFSTNILKKSGTSMATPAASALAIIVRQFFRDGFYPNLKKNSNNQITPSSSLIRSILVNSAVKPNSSEDDNEKAGPDFFVGFGIPCLESVLGFRDSGLRIVDNVEMKSQSHHVYHIILDNNSCELRVTMNYLDPPLNPENEAIFFADLDLFVKSPKGKWFIGNGVDKIADSDSFSNTERVIIEKEEIPLNGGDFEIHIVSSHYPIDCQKVTYSIVINGPFEQTVSQKNSFFLQYKNANETDCIKDCSGNGKCNDKGICECNENSIGVSCNTKATTIKDGEINNETYVHKKIKYFKISPKVHSSILTSVDFHLSTDTKAASVFMCISTDKNPGKITNAAWQCHRVTKQNYSFEFSEEDDIKSFFLSIYVSFFNPAEVTLSDISVSSIEIPFTPETFTQEPFTHETFTPEPFAPETITHEPFTHEPFAPEPKSKNNKKVLFIVVIVVCGVIFVALLVGLIILIIIYQKKKKASIPDDLNENMINAASI